MMNSYQRNTSHRRLWAGTALVALLLFVDIISGGKVHALARAGVAALSRAWGGAIASVTETGFFSSRAGLTAQNHALSLQLSQYQERAAGFAVLQAENEQLRELVRLARASAGITAPVVSSLIASPYGTFLIGAGSADGIARGNLVLSGNLSGEDGFVVGVVSDVGPRTSTVRELFAPDASLNAVIHGAAVSLSGRGGGNAYASVPRGIPVTLGDTVTAPELGRRSVGVVGAVASSSAQAAQDVYIRLPVGFGTLQFVYVISS